MFVLGSYGVSCGLEAVKGMRSHYKKTLSELTETCPNHDVLIDGSLTENVRIDRIDRISIQTLFSCSVRSRAIYVVE